MKPENRSELDSVIQKFNSAIKYTITYRTNVSGKDAGVVDCEDYRCTIIGSDTVSLPG